MSKNVIVNGEDRVRITRKQYDKLKSNFKKIVKLQDENHEIISNKEGYAPSQISDLGCVWNIDGFDSYIVKKNKSVVEYSDD
tara:strand:- start:170 stop:415 length:246 start_codon:yes stop_codon:yes gene_type:complete